MPQIYKDIVGEREWVVDDTTSFTAEDKQLLAAICDENEIPVALVAKLLDTEQQMDGMLRRAGIHARIDAIFHEDWHSEDEARAPN